MDGPTGGARRSDGLGSAERVRTSVNYISLPRVQLQPTHRPPGALADTTSHRAQSAVTSSRVLGGAVRGYKSVLGEGPPPSIGLAVAVSVAVAAGRAGPCLHSRRRVQPPSKPKARLDPRRPVHVPRRPAHVREHSSLGSRATHRMHREWAQARACRPRALYAVSKRQRMWHQSLRQLVGGETRS